MEIPCMAVLYGVLSVIREHLMLRTYKLNVHLF